MRTLPETIKGAGWSITPGDALLLLSTLPDASVASILTDVPYSSGGQYRGDRTASTRTKYQTSDSGNVYPDFYGDSRDVRGFVAWVAIWSAMCWRVAEPGGVLASFIDWRMLPALTDGIQAGGWTWRGVAVWHKPIARRQLGRFAQECEFLVWGSKGDMPIARDVTTLPGRFEADPAADAAELEALAAAEGLAGFWSVNPVPGDRREHLTEKPVALMREIVRVTRPGGRILDPFGGAMSTLVAARLEGFEADAFELGEPYCRIGARRMHEFDLQAERGAFDRGQLALLDARPPLTADDFGGGS